LLNLRIDDSHFKYITKLGEENKNIERPCYLVSLLLMIFYNAKKAMSSLLEIFMNELRLDEICLLKAIGS
jgi:hypothetical protein